jgi:hypothetical protein
VFGEHSFSVRDQVPPKGAHGFQAKLRRSQKWLLQRFSFSGNIRSAKTTDLPRFAGTPGPPSRRVFVFLGFILRIGHRIARRKVSAC